MPGGYPPLWYTQPPGIPGSPGIPPPRYTHPPQEGPGTRHAHPLEGTWDQAYPPTTPCGQTHASENITYPQLRWLR